ncbi:MAG: DUF4369 domain-containing protein [Bacteroidaceae bacterium]|nr:DUF4369 domain-containing protein [Bacteroidaceae bacterium]
MKSRHTHILLFLLISLLTTSCGTSYNIKGSTDMSVLDGQKFFLKVFKNDDLCSLDSCDVLHGQFKFSGTIDTVKLAYITNEGGVLPIILEGGDIDITINVAEQKVTGTQYNEKFFNFTKHLVQVETSVSELSRRESRGIMNGEDMDSLRNELEKEYITLVARRDTLTTNFICNNFDNPLAAAAFQFLTITNRVPELTPWVEHILSKANDSFKNDGYVKDYVEKAKYVQGVMNGTVDPGIPTTAAAPTPTDSINN